MTYAGSFVVDVPGFKYLGLTKDGLWSKYIRDDGQVWSEEQRENWKREQENIKLQREAEESQRRAKSFSAQKRDILYRDLLSSLSLHPDDRADLKRRGLTDEQIKAGGFKSVEKWQRVAIKTHYRLPGVSLDGSTLNTQAGYLCPIEDVDGLIVGCQFRLRDSDDRGRYRWLSSVNRKRPDGPSPHLPNGELPLAVHRPGEVKPSSIGLVEGTGAKPLITSQRFSQVVVGAAGGQHASSPKTLKLTLEKLTAELGTQQIVLYPDAGAVTNPRVIEQCRRTLELLEELGYTDIQVAWWGQVEKSQGDIDELADLGAVQFITPEQFLSLCDRHNPDRLLGKLKKVFWQVLKRSKPKGFQPREPKPVDQAVEYQQDERLSTWNSATKQGFKYILDSSPTGTGKSYDAGRAKPEQFGARQIFYWERNIFTAWIASC